MRTVRILGDNVAVEQGQPIKQLMSRWARTRKVGKCWAGVSRVGENKAKLVGCGFGSINGMVGLRPALVGLGVSECSLNDSTHGTHAAGAGHRQ